MRRTIVLGGGCSWCLDAIFRQVNGVEEVECGYAGGNVSPVSYREVMSGLTGHAEVVSITYDDRVITTEALLNLFFLVHDPTTLNRQGFDVGTQYRSVVFVNTDEDIQIANRALTEAAQSYAQGVPVVTTIEPLSNYVKAEEYHQNYYTKYLNSTEEERSEMNVPYCQVVVGPKLARFRQAFKRHLKT